MQIPICACTVRARFVEDEVFRRQLIEEMRNDPLASELILKELAKDLIDALLYLKASRSDHKAGL